MDKIEKYQDIIIQFLEEYAAIPYANSTIEKQVLADRERNHFQLFSIGWENNQFDHSIIFHFDIKDGKVWIQQNWTEVQIGDELVERGIPATDIVLGFQPPYARAYTGFAAA